MRRLFVWILPLAASGLAVGLFGFGFVEFLRGNTGDPVDLAPPSEVRAAPRGFVAPIVLGDSLARGAGDPEGLGIPGRLDAELRRRGIRARRAVNIGVNGARTPDLLRQLESQNVRALVGESNVVIVSIGGNDLWGGTDWRTAAPDDADAAMDRVAERIATIVERIRAVNPKARIFLVGLYNPFVATPEGPTLGALVTRWNARLAERFGSDPDFTLVPTADLFSHRDRLALDRFHPGAEGYALIARRIADAL